MQVKIKLGKMQYDLKISGKLTVIDDDSVTSKSLLYNIVSKYPGNHAKIECELPVIAINSIYDFEKVKTKSVVIIDEVCECARSHELCTKLREIDSYFILISRIFRYNNLPYSVDAIYEMKSSNGIRILLPKYDSFFTKNDGIVSGDIVKLLQETLKKDKSCVKREGEKGFEQYETLIYFGFNEEALYQVDSYFDVVHEREWLQHPLAKRILEDLCGCISIEDESLVVADIFVEGEYVTISPQQLSTGVKTLLVLLNTDEFVDINSCGDNCSRWIYEISKIKSLHIALNYCMHFDEIPDNFISENDNVCMKEIMDYLIECGIWCYNQNRPDNWFPEVKKKL